MRQTIWAIALVAFASPALASQCPALWQQINDKMVGVHLSEADQAKMAELRKQGDELHHAGKHAESEAALNEALALLAPS